MTLSPRSHPRRWSAMAMLVATLWAPWTAQAALFGDDEARRGHPCNSGSSAPRISAGAITDCP